MAGLKITLTNEILKGIEKRFLEAEEPIAIAAQAAIDETAEQLKSLGRKDIARAGFSQKWQNALRVDIFPRYKGNRPSIGAAAFMYHAINYANVFEEGPTNILGSPLLWLPFRSTPKLGSGKRTSPRNYEDAGIDLFPLRSGRGLPLLAANIRVSKARARRSSIQATLTHLKRGTGGRGTVRAVPLFFGVKRVEIADKFHLAEIADAQRNLIEARYYKHFKVP